MSGSSGNSSSSAPSCLSVERVREDLFRSSLESPPWSLFSSPAPAGGAAAAAACTRQPACPADADKLPVLVSAELGVPLAGPCESAWLQRLSTSASCAALQAAVSTAGLG